MKTAALDVVKLRRAFDAGFAKPHAQHREASQHFLLGSVKGGTLAVRLGEVASILRCPAIVPLPSRNPATAGLCAIRGRLVVVYDLSVLLERRLEPQRKGALIRCAADDSVALLFDAPFEYVSVETTRIAASPRSDVPSSREILRLDGASHAVLDINEQLNSILQSADMTRSDDS